MAENQSSVKREYDVVSSVSLDGLVETINSRLAEGWEVVGGVTVIEDKFIPRKYIQAIVRTTLPQVHFAYMPKTETLSNG